MKKFVCALFVATLGFVACGDKKDNKDGKMAMMSRDDKMAMMNKYGCACSQMGEGMTCSKDHMMMDPKMGNVPCDKDTPADKCVNGMMTMDHRMAMCEKMYAMPMMMSSSKSS